MAVMIQIRDESDALHRKLKAQAALAGRSSSDYLLDEIWVPDGATLDQLRTRLQGRTSVNPSISPERAVRDERDSR